MRAVVMGSGSWGTAMAKVVVDGGKEAAGLALRDGAGIKVIKEAQG